MLLPQEQQTLVKRLMHILLLWSVYAPLLTIQKDNGYGSVVKYFEEQRVLWLPYKELVRVSRAVAENTLITQQHTTCASTVPQAAGCPLCTPVSIRHQYPGSTIDPNFLMISFLGVLLF